jgi:ribosome-associated protein
MKLIDPATAPASKRAASKGKDAKGKDEAAEALHALVMQSLDDDQAQEVISIPLEGKSNIADYMIVASGRSSRQVASMAQKLAERIKKAGRNARIEGLPSADWVLIDAEDVIVHLFRPEVRSFYNLERMWAFGDDDGPAN